MNAPTAIEDVSAQSHDQWARDNTFRIGIIGCGPRGLYGLQSLTDELRCRHLSRSVSVVIIEPAEYFGSGNIYDPRQPEYLRMNFAAMHVDAWPRDGERDHGRLSLVDWLSRSVTAARCPHEFISRGEVGAYLHDCFRQVLADLQRLANVTVAKSAVSSVRLTDAGDWEVRADSRTFLVDELLVTTGHGGWDVSWRHQDELETPPIPAFPPVKNLSIERILPKSRVAIRGFGLTWIDAVLAMTEGRGGAFERNGEKWHYYPSGSEPTTIAPFSRTGRPMLAKPDTLRFEQPPELDEIWALGRASINAITRPVTPFVLENTLSCAVMQAAAAAVNHFAKGRCRLLRPESIRAWFDCWCREPMQPPAAIATLEQSYAVATGRSAPDIAWALGAAWRNLYPALVQCVSHGGLAVESWPAFRHLAVEMERIAFGPPAENVGRMLALVEASIVDLRFITGILRYRNHNTTRLLTLCNDLDSTEIDHVVDAVLPSPIQLDPSGPLYHLFENGIIERMAGGQGIHVDQAGRPLLGGRATKQGLAILGRPTEGCILGNDTLSRKLHDHPRQWAASVIARMRSAESIRAIG
jgi:uncharacterized NAD(P)/FAD-binding protein YdhS